MSRHVCKICFTPLPRDQVTCGGLDCRDAWKFLNSAARKKKINLAAMSPAERAYCLSQGPSQDEVEAATQQREQLDTELEEYQRQQQKKADSGFMPKSLRDMLIANAPIKKDTNGNPEPADANDTNPITNS